MYIENLLVCFAICFNAMLTIYVHIYVYYLKFLFIDSIDSMVLLQVLDQTYYSINITNITSKIQILKAIEQCSAGGETRWFTGQHRRLTSVIVTTRQIYWYY